MSKIGILAISALPVLLIFTACGRSSSSGFQLRIHDTLDHTNDQITASDVLPGSARVHRMTGESAGLYFRFTDEGKAKFRGLTYAIAKRGKRLHRSQRFAIEINGKVYGRPLIDYTLFPNGFDGERGLEVAGLALSTAQQFANQINNG